MPDAPPLCQVARDAMATRFEVVLPGADTPHLRAAAEEALDEVERIEGQLSRFQPSSEVARLNRNAGGSPVRVGPALLQLLDVARRVWMMSNGAFDPTVGPLMRTMGCRQDLPAEAENTNAPSPIGLHGLELFPNAGTARLARPGMELDLGAIGKGYAIDAAAEVLRGAGIGHGFLHAGTSTAMAWGMAPGGGPWRVGIPTPESGRLGVNASQLQGSEGGRNLLARVDLQDEALSVSAIWGGRPASAAPTRSHIIDPRTRRPVEDNFMAAVICRSATESDAWSTALLVGGRELQESLRSLRPHLRTLLVCKQAPQSWTVSAHGIRLEPGIDPG